MLTNGLHITYKSGIYFNITRNDYVQCSNIKVMDQYGIKIWTPEYNYNKSLND